jgi:predicted RNA-binding protein with PIN domain
VGKTASLGPVPGGLPGPGYTPSVGAPLTVDGYNVIYAWDDLRELLDVSLELARDRLVERLSTLVHLTDTEVTVVFDAGHGVSAAGSQEVRDGVRMVFTRRGTTADHLIERCAYQARRRGQHLEVATSDRFHGAMLRGMGAAVIDARELRRRVERAEAEVSRRLAAPG